METLLNDAAAVAVEIKDESSLSVIRERIRRLAVPQHLLDRAVLVATELGRNQLRHAREGTIEARALDGGIELVAADEGAGIFDIAAALDAMPRETGTLGVGIGAARRLASELDVDVRLGEGACITARIVDRAAPRRREVGVYGRPIAGEAASGDHACFVRIGGALVVAVCDGLGHGPAAREAADAAIDVFREHAALEPAAILEECNRRILGTRGVVMAVARIDEVTGHLDLASVGNVEAGVSAFRRVRRFGGVSAVIGGRPGTVKARTESAVLSGDDVLLLMTDGIRSKASIEMDAVLLRSHPAAIAQQVLADFARPNDDALVLVVR